MVRPMVCQIERNRLEAFLACGAQVFTNTVEYDDRRIDRVTENGQRTRDKVLVERQLEDDIDRQHGQKVMNQADDSSQTRGKLKAERDVDEHQNNGNDCRQESCLLQVVTDRLTDVFVGDQIVIGQTILFLHRSDHVCTLLTGEAGRTDDNFVVLIARDLRCVGFYTGRVLYQSLNLIEDICVELGVFHAEFHLRAAGKVDVEVIKVHTERKCQQADQTGDAEQDGNNSKNLKMLYD